MKMCPVVHFEMPAEDKARVKKFYTDVFGWKMEQEGEEMKGYILATTTPAGEDGRPKEPGAINGGFFDKGPYGTAPHLVVSVDDLVEHIEVVKSNGGKVLGEPMDIPGIGKFVMIEDSEANRIGMLQLTMLQ